MKMNEKIGTPVAVMNLDEMAVGWYGTYEGHVDADTIAVKDLNGRTDWVHAVRVQVAAN